MVSAPASRILLCGEAPSVVDDVRRLLEEAGHLVGWHLLGAAEPDDLLAYELVILEGSQQNGAALQLCRRLRIHLADGFIPILFVTDDHAPPARLASFENGADTCLLRPFDPGELLAQVQAFLRIKGLHTRLTEKTAEVHRINRWLQQAYQRIDQELDLARRIQQSFLPQSLPEVPWVRFAVHYKPCGRVGGDFYDVFRLDENHVGFYIADVMGHGVPASLLTIFLKKAVKPKEINGSQYRLVPPDEVLVRLNRDLIEQGLSENPFITMVYGLFDRRETTLHFARAGHPHPLYLPEIGEPNLWKAQGPLLGVFEADFAAQTHQLQPGDKVLFYTDGAESITFEDNLAGTSGLLACAGLHRNLSIQELIQKLSENTRARTDLADDFTLLGLEVKK